MAGVVGIGHEEKLLAIEGAGGKVSSAVGVECVGLFVGKFRIAEDVCCMMYWLCCGLWGRGALRAAVASWGSLRRPFAVAGVF